MSRTRRRAGIVALLLASAVVAGCAAQPGAAAIVGERRISVTDLQSATSDVRTLVGPDAQIGQPQVLSWLILAPFVLDEAARLGLGTSADDARRQFSQDPQRQVRAPSAAAVLAVQSALAISRLQSQLQPEQSQQVYQDVLARVRASGVEVSPRYGRFDYESFSVQAVRPDWISGGPAGSSPPTPSPTPTP